MCSHLPLTKDENYSKEVIQMVFNICCQNPTWNVNAGLALVKLVHVLYPRQLRPELLSAGLALPVPRLWLVGGGLKRKWAKSRSIQKCL